MLPQVFKRFRQFDRAEWIIVLLVCLALLMIALGAALAFAPRTTASRPASPVSTIETSAPEPAARGRVTIRSGLGALPTVTATQILILAEASATAMPAGTVAPKTRQARRLSWSDWRPKGSRFSRSTRTPRRAATQTGRIPNDGRH